MSLHPEVEKMIALSPKAMTVGGNPVVEDDRAFARRIALRAVELEREECAKVVLAECSIRRADYSDYQYPIEAQILHIMHDTAGMKAADAIRRRGKP